jgi:hypothetical protein
LLVFCQLWPIGELGGCVKEVVYRTSGIAQPLVRSISIWRLVKGNSHGCSKSTASSRAKEMLVLPQRSLLCGMSQKGRMAVFR